MRNKRLLSRGTVRSTSALVMLAYVICHLGNHILLLISIPFADEAHHFLVDPWRTIPGTALLLIAVLAHYANALWSIYMRRSLIMPHWGWWQLGLGLSIPLILLLHLASTRISEVEWGVVSDYSSVLLRLWVLAPWKGVTQIALLSAVWAHAASISGSGPSAGIRAGDRSCLSSPSYGRFWLWLAMFQPATRF